MLTKKKPEQRTRVEINPYVTDDSMGRKQKGIVETFLSFIPFLKKKEEPRVNPFLVKKKREQPEIITEPTNPGNPQNPASKGWLWYIPIAIAEQVEWVKSHTTEGRKIIEKKREERARYEQFESLFDKKD